MALFWLLHDVTGSRYLKMVAAKPEVLTSGSNRDSFIEFLDPQNINFAVGISLLSCLGTEI